MSREVKIGTGDDFPVDAAEIIAEFEAAAGEGEVCRQAAVARYLSASDGWKDAMASLGGKFAPGPHGNKVK